MAMSGRLASPALRGVGAQSAKGVDERCLCRYAKTRLGSGKANAYLQNTYQAQLI
jgi:hypothetical protein